MGTEYLNTRRTTMNYTKPEVNTLGDATTVIETINPLKPPVQQFETGTRMQLAAYDLDE
jgi:hypothetical protein